MPARSLPTSLCFAPVSAESRAWVDTVRALKERLDPAATWHASFEEFRNRFGDFRQMEGELFFEHRETEIVQRAHRGFLASLISEADRLAVALLTIEIPVAEKNALNSQVDAFAENLQSTMEVWHSRSMHEWAESELIAADC